MREALKKRRYRSFSEQRAAHALCQTVHHIRVKSRWNKLREERREKVSAVVRYSSYDINFRPSFFPSLSLSCSLPSTGISSLAMTVADVLSQSAPLSLDSLSVSVLSYPVHSSALSSPYSISSLLTHRHHWPDFNTIFEDSVWNIPSVCLSFSQPVCQIISHSVHQSVCLSVCTSVHQWVSQSVCPPVLPSVSQSVSLSACPSISQSVSLSIGLSVCLSISQTVCLSLLSLGLSVSYVENSFMNS